MGDWKTGSTACGCSSPALIRSAQWQATRWPATSRSGGTSSAHRVGCTYGQRVWKRQPARRVRRARQVALRAGSSRAAARSPGRGSGPPTAARSCTGAAGCRRARRPARPRRSRPRYMTAMRSEMCRTTARSWAMKRYVRSNSRLQLLEQVHDLRLDRDVERRDGLVADDEVRVERERPREPDALPLAARELVRVARGGVARAGRRRRAARARGSATDLRSPTPCTLHRLADHAPDAVPRVQRRERVLEDHLHAPPQRAQLALAEVRDVPAVEADRARRSARRAAGSRGRRVDLPQPDSPTSPSVSPRPIESDTPSTAFTSPTWRSSTRPLLIGNQTLRSSTSTSGSRRRAHAGRRRRALRRHSSRGHRVEAARPRWPGSSSSSGGSSSRDCVDRVAAARRERARARRAEHVARRALDRSQPLLARQHRAAGRSAAGRACTGGAAARRAARRCPSRRTCPRTSRSRARTCRRRRRGRA